MTDERNEGGGAIGSALIIPAWALYVGGALCALIVIVVVPLEVYQSTGVWTLKAESKYTTEKIRENHASLKETAAKLGQVREEQIARTRNVAIVEGLQAQVKQQAATIEDLRERLRQLEIKRGAP